MGLTGFEGVQPVGGKKQGLLDDQLLDVPLLSEEELLSDEPLDDELAAGDELLDDELSTADALMVAIERGEVDLDAIVQEFREE